jgi:hypothetical protein
VACSSAEYAISEIPVRVPLAVLSHAPGFAANRENHASLSAFTRASFTDFEAKGFTQPENCLISASFAQQFMGHSLSMTRGEKPPQGRRQITGGTRPSERSVSPFGIREPRFAACFPIKARKPAMASPAKIEPSAFLKTLISVSPEELRLDPRSYVAVSSRAEAEYLLMLDHSGARTGPEWRAFMIEALVGFLIWQSQPFGELSESDLDWFIGVVADAPSPTLPALLFALARELNDAPERLIALALKHAAGRNG